MLKTKKSRHLLLSIFFLFVFANLASAQVDTSGPAKQDTVKIAQDTTKIIQDTAKIVKDTTAIIKDTSAAKKSDKKFGKKSHFIIYAGVNLNQLQVSSDKYESIGKPGWHFGASYKHGKLLYWQAGARFNSARYGLDPVNGADTTYTLTINNLDIPITGGINLLPFMYKVVNVRLFVSAIPAFALSVKSDDALGIKKDNTNGVNFYGQAGLGIDILSLVLEAGYNYGFTDQLKNDKSNPGQVFFNLGVRF